MAQVPIWVVITHFLNILFMTLLARSGLEILSAFPKLYLRDDCMPGGELVRFTKKRFAPAAHPTWSSLEEEEAWPRAIALPGRKSLGLGRHWHFLTVEFWILTGIVYVALLFASGQWRRLVPTDWAIVPQALRDIATYLSGRLPAAQPGLPYNAAQQLAYFAVVFALAPLQILTGAAMSPAVIGRSPRYARVFGGRQAARTLHLAGLCAFAAFVVVHTAMVIIHGLGGELARIALTTERANHALALAVFGAALVAVALVNALATVVSVRRPRATQRTIGALVDPWERQLVERASSRQRYRPEQISPFFRVNGHPPPDGDYRRLAAAGFRAYRLRVHGLVEREVEVSLAELRALGMTTQITLHNCIQGWSNVARWSGVPLAALLDRCRPLDEARFVVFRAFDDKAQTEGDGRFGHFYGSLPVELAGRPQTILALEMNGAPLPIDHGAPVRLRVETQLGFKMVKWIRDIELASDIASIGMGQGGWREDQQFYTSFAGI